MLALRSRKEQIPANKSTAIQNGFINSFHNVCFKITRKYNIPLAVTSSPVETAIDDNLRDFIKKALMEQTTQVFGEIKSDITSLRKKLNDALEATF